MKATDKYITEKFGEIWSFNLQKIEEIHSELERSLSDLEQYYAGFEPLYDKVESILKLLTALYNNFGVIEGRDRLNKLSAVISAYRKRYTADGINFELIEKIESKITSLLDRSFEDFPFLESGGGLDIIDAPPDEKKFDPAAYTFRWITFERNGSAFIVPFESLEVRPAAGCEVISFTKPDQIELKIEENIYRASDIFSGYPDKFEEPAFIISINGGASVYPAAKILRKIFAREDFVSEKVIPFPGGLNTSKSPGRVRIFGRNHILLSGTQ
jgi:hypothetical protein